MPPQVAQPQTVVPSGNPDLRSALVRVLAVPERSGSGPQEHPVGLLHGRQEQEDPAATGESNRTAPHAPSSNLKLLLSFVGFRIVEFLKNTNKQIFVFVLKVIYKNTNICIYV